MPTESFWLTSCPLLQLLIYLANLVSGDPLLIRYLMSLVGALAGVAFYLFSATLLDRTTARLASLFFIFNPFLLVHSIVPYQEILMLLFLCLGLHCMLRLDQGSPLGQGGTSGGFTKSIPRTNLSLTPPCPRRGNVGFSRASAGPRSSSDWLA